MHETPLELSKLVRRSRYSNFPKSADANTGVFMVGFEECSPDYLIERQDFPFWMLEFIAGGHGFYQQGSQRRHLRHGAIFTYGPGLPQRFGNEADHPFRKYFMVSDSVEFPLAWQQAGLVPGAMMQLSSGASLVSIFDQLLDEGQQSDTHTASIVSGLQQVLLALIARHQGPASGEKSGSRKAYELSMETLLRHYKSLNGLTDIATRTGYSSEYLCRIFKKYHGESPYQVLLHRKMSEAWLLLRDGQYQVSAVAREVGYEDPLHFSRTFRKIMGCPPSSVKMR